MVRREGRGLRTSRYVSTCTLKVLGCCWWRNELAAFYADGRSSERREEHLDDYRLRAGLHVRKEILAGNTIGPVGFWDMEAGIQSCAF